MSYTTSDFSSDAVKCANTLHLAYRRATFLLDRWYAGMDQQFANDTAMTLLAARCAEIVQDYEADGRAKLNTILAMSNLTLPGDQD